VGLAKKTLKPSVYEDTRHILENLRAVPQPGGSISVSNYASKRTFSVASNENTLRMENATSCENYGGNIVGRVTNNTGGCESHDSFPSRISRSSYAANTLTSMSFSHSHTTVKEIFQILSSANEGLLYLINYGYRPDAISEEKTKESDS